MNRDWYKPLMWLIWLGLPTTALNYWRSWDQLPVRRAVHFYANWQPNGYTSREGSLILSLGVMAFMLVAFTLAAHIVRAQKPTASWAMLIVFYISLGLFGFASNGMVTRNLDGQSPHAVVVSSGFPTPD